MLRLIVTIMLGVLGYMLATKPAEVWKHTESWKTLGGIPMTPRLAELLRLVGIGLLAAAAIVLIMG